MISNIYRRATLLLGSSSLAALSLLGGCATFGSNVKGSFSCAAPDGICAPSSSIDDRALAIIAGESGAGVSPLTSVSTRRRQSSAAGQIVPASPLDVRRTQERVLRIVFQPYLDERGRLHEASAVHAVVQDGEWQQQALADTTTIPDRNAVASYPQTESFVEALDRAELAATQSRDADPNLPDPAAVAAARARRVDPVRAIQDDVAARLAPKAGRTPALPAARRAERRAERRSVDGASPATTPGEAKAADTQAAKPASRAVVAPPVGAVTLPSKPTATEAALRVKTSPEFQAKADRAESDARAASRNSPTPPIEAKVQPTVRAAGFPAAVPEEN